MIGNSKMLYYSQTCGIHVHIALSLFIKYQNNSRKSLDLLVNTKIIPEKKEKKNAVSILTYGIHCVHIALSLDIFCKYVYL